MSANPLQQTIEALAKEKGVSQDIIIAALQDAIEAAARKKYKNENMRARFNTESGQMELVAVKTIVEAPISSHVVPYSSRYWIWTFVPPRMTRCWVLPSTGSMLLVVTPWLEVLATTKCWSNGGWKKRRCSRT